jgi:hypothetical protein
MEGAVSGRDQREGLKIRLMGLEWLGLCLYLVAREGDDAHADVVAERELLLGGLLVLHSAVVHESVRVCCVVKVVLA